MKTSLKIRNYTSTVPAQRTIAAIEEMLGNAGALHIGKTYSGGEVVGLMFQLMVDDAHPVMFKLPCQVEPVATLLTPPNLKTWKSDYKTRCDAIRGQARRTAWRLMHDWIAVQLAMIQLGQAEAMQVFLPYAYDSRDDKTFFEHVRDDGYKQLPAPQGATHDGEWREAEEAT